MNIEKMIGSQHADYKANALNWENQIKAVKGGKLFVSTNLQGYEGESAERLARRKLLTRCEPICREAIEKVLQTASSGYAGWSFNLDKEHQELSEIIENNIDSNNQGLSVWIVNEVMKRLLINGSCWVQADSPIEEYASEEERKLAGSQPYLNAWWAGDVVNWVEQGNGYSSVLVKFMEAQIDEETGFELDAEKYFRLYTAENITTINSDGMIISSIPNTLGFVPFYRVNLDRSFIEDLIDVQKDAVNTLGDIISFRQDANFGFYVIEGNDKGELPKKARGSTEYTGETKGNGEGNVSSAVEVKPSELGQNRVVVVKEGSGGMSYVSPDTANANFSMDYMARLDNTADKLSNQVLRSVALTNSVVAQSGLSKKEDAKPMSAGIIAYLSTLVEQAVEPAIEAMCVFFHKENKISITVPTVFEVETEIERSMRAEQYLLEAETASTISPTASLYKREQWADCVMHGATTETKMQVQKEISVSASIVDVDAKDDESIGDETSDIV